ncbi:MAG: hypothetical protein CMJ23_00975 [Phycisphaerae bacterium]|nr:hypothetical protein [Phycisphaerae bacterium]
MTRSSALGLAAATLSGPVLGAGDDLSIEDAYGIYQRAVPGGSRRGSIACPVRRLAVYRSAPV